jgi:hypothetical protein
MTMFKFVGTMLLAVPAAMQIHELMGGVSPGSIVVSIVYIFIASLLIERED